MEALLAGFGLSFSLILAIGAQNAFVLRQGLRQEHVFWVCFICAVSDALLILAGVFGFAILVQKTPGLEPLMRYAGSAFLIVYGARSFWAAWRTSNALQPSEQVPKSLWATALTCLAITWLNPHVYLDTVVLIGTVATHFENNKGAFAVGAMFASLAFFFALGYGAVLLRPFFAKPRSWRLLEILVGLVMWAIAAKLLLG